MAAAAAADDDDAAALFSTIPHNLLAFEGQAAAFFSPIFHKFLFQVTWRRFFFLYTCGVGTAPTPSL